jgi:hypothetical protein
LKSFSHLIELTYFEIKLEDELNEFKSSGRIELEETINKFFVTLLVSEL